MSHSTPSTRHDTLPAGARRALALLVLAAGCMAGSANAAPAKGAGTTKAVANLASCAKPVYPADALAAKHTGTVTLAFLIGSSGEVLDSQVKKSSGHAALDEAAQKAIRQCKFSAATAKGKPVESWAKIEYVWTL